MKISNSIRCISLKWYKDYCDNLLNPKRSYKEFCSDINCGDCDIFAMELSNIYPKGRVLWGDDVDHFFCSACYDGTAHCFFKYGKKYYDSECCEGVTNPILLPFYVRQKELWDKRYNL